MHEVEYTVLNWDQRETDERGREAPASRELGK